MFAGYIDVTNVLRMRFVYRLALRLMSRSSNSSAERVLKASPKRYDVFYVEGGSSLLNLSKRVGRSLIPRSLHPRKWDYRYVLKRVLKVGICLASEEEWG